MPKTIAVPGARLTYDVTGSGPVLFLVGTPMGATGFAALVPHLAEDFTVVTFDPRGIARSTADDPTRQVHPEDTADDLAAVLAEVTDEPAYVLGSSGGAIGTLALVLRHPDRVHTAVVHEPPLSVLLPDAEEIRATTHEIVDTLHTAGWQPAMGRFFDLTGVLTSMSVNDQPPPAPSEEMARGTEYFIANYLRTVALWAPDLEALRAARPRVVVAAGRTSTGQLANRTAVALAAALGTDLALFSGDHGGFSGEPKAFAAELRAALAG
ncbi:alpha/beta fold hydrolase [Actinophytocola sp. NPDC049390]|uniref:alpha/beta fold hydrolase n=1 Tax=Actinophytocola sp. NPDC049390 TaxID=3363894 RepID=UPI0037AF89B2